MSYYNTLKLCLAIGVLAAMLACSASLTYGVTGCQPETPCPCAADGICRPKRETWGHYKTRWRTWPGELRGDEPELADTPSATEETLPPFETPTPEQEDLRGPAKKDAPDEATAEDGDPLDVPAQLLPGPEALPAIDPQGSQLHEPQLEDAPPELPASLRQAALLLNLQPTVQAQASPAIGTPPIHQATWRQPSAGLINPASAAVIEPEADSLQQAIYYEASDESNDAVE